MTTVQELDNVFHQLPVPVLNDINHRIGDWLVSGGSITDDYVKRQFQYAFRVVERNKQIR